MPRPTVFLSYSHVDEEWKDRLLPHLRILEHLGMIDLWHDRRIDAGETWYPEIRHAMERATVAVCLISAPYLASAFCFKEEVPYLLERRARDGHLPAADETVTPGSDRQAASGDDGAAAVEWEVMDL